MIFDTDRRVDDVDDLIFDRTTVTPSQRWSPNSQGEDVPHLDFGCGFFVPIFLFYQS